MSQGIEQTDNVGQAVGGEVKPEPYRVVIISILSLATLANFLVLFNLGVLLPSISDDLGLSPSEQGWLGSSAILANLVVSVPLGWWISRLNAKLVVSITLAAAAFFLFVQGWAPVFALLLVGRVFFGVAGMAREPARAMLTQQWVPREEIVLVNGVLNGTIGVAIGIGFFVTPYMLLWFDDGWRTAFYIYAIATLAIGVAWQIFGRERITRRYRQAASSQEGTPLRSLLRYRELWGMSMGLVGANMLWMSIATFWPTLMLDYYDISLVTSGTMLALGGIMSSVFGLVFAFAAARWGLGRHVLVLCGILTSSTSAAMSLTGSVPLLWVLNVLNGTGWSFFPVLMTVPFQLRGIKPREIAVAVAFYEMSMWAGGAIGPALAGILQEITGDLKLTMVILSFAGLSLVFGALFMRSPNKSEMQLEPVGAGNPESAS